MCGKEAKIIVDEFLAVGEMLQTLSRLFGGDLAKSCSHLFEECFQLSY